jgi:LuxR family maltose regulon positive regulatory protein
VDGFSAQLLALRAQGKEEAFQVTLQTFREFVQERNRPHFRSWFFSVQTRLALQENNLPQAEQHFQQVELSEDDQNFLFWMEDPRITHCRLLLARNTVQSLEEAAQRLSSYLKKATAHHLALLTIEVRILLALLAQKQNHPEAAIDHLEKAIQLADASGALYLFTEVADDIKTLLPQINPAFQTLELFRDLNQQIHSSLGKSRPPHVNEKLTNREMDVLVLMEQRLTNQEIASELSISVATIKRHAISIYRKLAAKNRREAVLKAVQEGILLLHVEDS